MAYQLVYTSAAKLLDAGRSGFGTVARSKSISPLLTSAIERVSQFTNLRGTDRARVIFVHRRINAANNRFHLLTRIRDAGADYTGRTNHLAHHLIVSLEEVARAAARGLTPADVLSQFAWLNQWDGAARFFNVEEDVALEKFQPHGRQSARANWTRLAGNPCHARLLAWDGAPRTGILLVPRNVAPLPLLAEALSEFGAQSWSRSFTTSLETTDEMSDLDWIVSTPENFRDIQSRCGSRTMLNLGQPQSLPLPPEPAQIVAAQPASPQTRTSTPIHVAIATGRQTNNPHASTYNPVQIGSRKGERSANGPVSTPVKLRTSWTLYAAIAVVALGLLGVFGWMVLSPKVGKTQEPSRSQSDDQKHAKEILTEKGIPDSLAENFVQVVKDNPEGWANFVTEFIEKINSAKPVTDLANLPEPLSRGRTPTGPTWLTNLLNAQSSIRDYANVTKETNSNAGTNLANRLKPLDKSRDFLIESAKSLEERGITKEAIEKFYNVSVKNELNSFFELKHKNGYTDNDLIPLQNILKTFFDIQKKPSSYAVFCKCFQGHFEDFTKNPMAKIFEQSGATVKNNDHLYFDEAIKLWNDPKEKPSTGFPENLGNGFVPKNFEELRGKHNDPKKKNPSGAIHEENPGANSKALPAPDMTGVSDKQVIVVTRDDLKKGVKVELLERLLKNAFTKPKPKPNKKLTNLTIKIDPEDTNNIKTALIHSDSDDFYCWTELKDPSAIKFYKNGMVSSENQSLYNINFTYNKEIEQKQTYIAIDDKKAPALFEAMNFSFGEKSGNTIVVSGEIAQWLTATESTDPLEVEKASSALIPTVSIAINTEAKNIIITQTTPPIPQIVFSDQNQNAIRDALNKYTNAHKQNGGTNKKQEKDEITKKQALEAIKEDLVYAIGGGELTRLMELKDESEIKGNKDLFHKTLKILTDPKIAPWDKESDWDREIENAKSKIGDKYFKDQLAKIGVIKNWDSFVKDEPGLKTVQDNINAILRTTTKPTPLPPLDEEIKKITSITVKTKQGRVLFIATPRK